MNIENKASLRPECFFVNSLSDSSLILCGISASTPISSSVEPDIINFDVTSSYQKDKHADDTWKYKKYEINFGSEPIFGRRNLQSLFGEADEPTTLASQKETRFSKLVDNCEKSINECIRKPSIKIYCDDSTEKNVKEKNSIINRESKTKKNLKKNENKPTSNSATKIHKMHKVISLRRSINSTKRRSCRSENQQPIFKVAPKCPKSPKLITALRAKTKQNRDRIGKENQKLVQNQQNSGLRQSKKEDNPGAIPKSIKSLTLSPTRNASGKKNQKSFVRHGSKIVSDRSAIKRVRNNAGHVEKNSEKFVPFKAQPIRKYSAVEVVSKHKITIPESPKFRYRPRLSSYPR